MAATPPVINLKEGNASVPVTLGINASVERRYHKAAIRQDRAVQSDSKEYYHGFNLRSIAGDEQPQG